MSAIKRVFARQVLDSRGNPTVEAVVETSNSCAKSCVPSGASTGKHEAWELRDGGKAFQGLGVLNAVKNVNGVISRKLKGFDVCDQESVDRLLCSLDGTANKSRLGANAILAVSMAVCRAAALDENVPLYKHVANLCANKCLLLPVPFCNIINGGKHAGNQLDIQEYMIVPKVKSFSEGVRIVCEVYHELKSLLEKNFGRMAVNVGDEGGFAPPMTCVEEPFDVILEAVNKLDYGKKVVLALDAAATGFYRNGKYFLEGSVLSSADLMGRYRELIDSYPLVSVEDPFFEEDWENFASFTKSVKVQVVGDDLLCTNSKRVQKALVYGSVNCLLLKVNQIGTVSEALEAANLALKNGWRVMVSHRSGETDDSFISDLSVGLGCGQIKLGAPARGERTAKYNQLLRIEDERVKYAKSV